MKKIQLVRKDETVNVYVDDVFYRTFDEYRKYTKNVNNALNYFRVKGILKKIAYNTYELVEETVELNTEEKCLVYVALLNYKQELEKYLWNVQEDEKNGIDPAKDNAYFIKKYTKDIEVADLLIQKLLKSKISSEL